MSCEQSSRWAALSAAGAGISRTGSKLAHTAGAYLTQINDISTRSLSTAAWLTGIAGPAARPRRMERLRKKAVDRGLRAVAGVAGLVDPTVGPVKKGVAVTRAATAALGSALAASSRTGDAGVVVQTKKRFFFFRKTEPVELWKSSLTRLLNRRDVLVEPNRVKSSAGVMFKLKDSAWHHGTLVVDSASGSRTMTHLQSLTVPAAHYFFGQQLTGEQAVSIAAGVTDPGTVPGYAGRVTAFESLSPAWSNAKQSLIKSYLHHPKGGVS